MRLDQETRWVPLIIFVSRVTLVSSMDFPQFSISISMIPLHFSWSFPLRVSSAHFRCSFFFSGVFLWNSSFPLEIFEYFPCSFLLSSACLFTLGFSLVFGTVWLIFHLKLSKNQELWTKEEHFSWEMGWILRGSFIGHSRTTRSWWSRRSTTQQEESPLIFRASAVPTTQEWKPHFPIKKTKRLDGSPKKKRPKLLWKRNNFPSPWSKDLQSSFLSTWKCQSSLTPPFPGRQPTMTKDSAPIVEKQPTKRKNKE